MKQREIQDSENVIWTCTQAFSGTDGEAARQAAEKAKNGGQVTVICTPSGGEQTVRLELQERWIEEMSDHALMEALFAGKNKS
jgi:hypothetical protein